MNLKIRTILSALGFGLGALVAAGAAHAGAIITSGSIALGVNDEGHLNTAPYSGSISTVNAFGGAVGLAYQFPDGSWRDATAPGCLCEGWGVSGSGVSGYANVDTDGGANNLSVDSFASSASLITSSVSVGGSALKVTQAYSVAVAGALFRNDVTIKNTGGTSITDVRYVRVMDWDVPPTEFDEFVTIKGTATTTFLERSHNNGFNTADPLGGDGSIDPSTEDVDFTHSGPDDHGAYFRFNFGTLAAGAEQKFTIFYGAAGNEAAMLSALSLVGPELYSLGLSDCSGPCTGSPTFAFGFKGVGGVVVPTIPEPETYAMLLAGLGLLGFVARRRKLKQAAIA